MTTGPCDWRTPVLRKLAYVYSPRRWLDPSCASKTLCHLQRKVRRQLQRTQRPLFASTARDVGLADDELVPALVPRLLPQRGARAASQRFLRRWLLAPPARATSKGDAVAPISIIRRGVPSTAIGRRPNLPRQKLVRFTSGEGG